jgi:hypothetical protein
MLCFRSLSRVFLTSFGVVFLVTCGSSLAAAQSSCKFTGEPQPHEHP